MGVGCLKPSASVACTNLLSRPNPSNVVIVVRNLPQRYGICRSGSQVKVPSAANLLMMGLRPADPRSALCRSGSQVKVPSAANLPRPYYLIILLILLAFSINSLRYTEFSFSRQLLNFLS